VLIVSNETEKNINKIENIYSENMSTTNNDVINNRSNNISNNRNARKNSKSRFKTILKGFKKTKYLQLMVIPGLIYYIIFHYIPIYGISIAFLDYKISKGFFGSPWIGLENFKLFLYNPYLLKLLRNTFLINIYGLFWGFPAPIILALFLNEVRNNKIKKAVQTISYLPHFISTVTVVSLITLILSPTTGIVNSIIKAL